MSDKKTIAIIGLGAMGSRMATRLMDAGYPLVVYNRSEGPVLTLQGQGAIKADTPAEAARQADLVISVVTNDEASKAVWLTEETGIAYGLNPQKIAISSSTLTPEWSERLGREMEKRGIPFLEAPVVGTRPQAESGNLVYLVGGRGEALDQIREVLVIMGSKVLHMGEVGEAMRMKLVINAMLGIQAAALGEVIQMIRSTMKNPEQVVGILKNLPVMSPLMTRLMGKMEPGDYSPNFPIELVEKDLGYFVEVFGKDNVEGSYVEATREIYAKAIQAGYGDDDITGIIQFFEKKIVA